MSRQTVRYYQLAGFEGHGNRWFERDSDTLARIIFDALQESPLDPHPINLVFGVRENGASYILATDEQIAYVERQAFEQFSRGSRAPFDSRAFVSLSPIFFRSREMLKEGLTKIYSGAKKGSNKKYTQGPSTDHSRAIFESNRNLYRILSKSISPRTFDLSDYIRTVSTRIVSLTFTVWEPHRQSQRKVLEAGWTEMPLIKDPTCDRIALDTSAISNVSHFDCTDFRLRIRGQTPAEFEFGDGKSGSLKHLQAELKDLLFCEKDKCLILLVHKKAQALSLCEEFGLDMGEIFGVCTALHLRPSAGLVGLRYLVIDVQDLFMSLSKLWNDVTISRMARELGFKADSDTYCAGNESRLILQCWLKMASGDIIDRQTELREQTIQAQQGASSKRKREATPEGDDDEIDANNIPQKRLVPVRTQPGQLIPPTDDDDDDDDFYD